MQQIDLSPGWGLYSTFISPEDGSLEDYHYKFKKPALKSKLWDPFSEYKKNVF